jgi:hypothetical protein
MPRQQSNRRNTDVRANPSKNPTKKTGSTPSDLDGKQNRKSSGYGGGPSPSPVRRSRASFDGDNARTYSDKKRTPLPIEDVSASKRRKA